MSYEDKLIYYRIRCGFTQVELAKRLQVPVRLVKRWENGRSLPSEKMINKLALVFNVSLEELNQVENIQSLGTSKNQIKVKQENSFILNKKLFCCSIMLVGLLITFIGVFTGLDGDQFVVFANNNQLNNSVISRHLYLIFMGIIFIAYGAKKAYTFSKKYENN